EMHLILYFLLKHDFKLFIIEAIPLRSYMHSPGNSTFLSSIGASSSEGLRSPKCLLQIQQPLHQRSDPEIGSIPAVLGAIVPFPPATIVLLTRHKFHSMPCPISSATL